MLRYEFVEWVMNVEFYSQQSIFLFNLLRNLIRLVEDLHCPWRRNIDYMSKLHLENMA